MADLKKLLLGSIQRQFVDLFNATFYPSNGGSHTNAYNGWDIFAQWTAGGGGNEQPCINGSEISMSQGSGNNWGMIRLTRSLEGYSTNRPFKATFSYMHNPYWNGGNFQAYNHYSDIVVSIGGDTSITGLAAEPKGLAFHSSCCTDSNFVRVKNNGSIIGTPYTDNARAVQYYLHTYYDGAAMKLTRSTSPTPPNSYDYSYPVTDRTQTSNTLMIYCYVQGFGDYYGGVKFYDYTETLF